MTYDSHFGRYELFVATATIGAHANSAQSGFRQRDVRFLIELFSNWVEVSLDSYALPVKNTQILRYISDLVEEGFARKITRKGYPHYRLTRIGLIELLSRLVERSYVSRREQFCFLFYFISNYRPRLEALIKAEGKSFPYALKAEIEALLDTKQLLKREMQAASQELKKLEERVHDAKRTSRYMSVELHKGRELSDVIAEVQRLYPYELNSQKPLTELMASIPEDTRRWELEKGNLKRLAHIWEPNRRMLKSYLKELEKLAEELRND